MNLPSRLVHDPHDYVGVVQRGRLFDGAALSTTVHSKVCTASNEMCYTIHGMAANALIGDTMGTHSCNA